MELSIGLNKRYQIYQDYLEEIAGVRFTMREVDIIACIFHNRKGQSISSLLSISAKTVEAHVYNIRGKLGYAPKDHIIDFIEKSGKLEYLRQYYTYLLIHSIFEKQLHKIGQLLTKSEIICYLSCEDAEDKQNTALLQNIEHDLQMANIVCKKPENSIDQTKYHLYILSDSSSLSQSNENQILLVPNYDKEKHAGNIKCLDISNDEGYYCALFIIVKKLINKPEIDKIAQEFENDYNSLKNLEFGYPINKEKTSVPYLVSFIRKSIISRISSLGSWQRGVIFVTIGAIIFCGFYFYQDKDIFKNSSLKIKPFKQNTFNDRDLLYDKQRDNFFKIFAEAFKTYDLTKNPQPHDIIFVESLIKKVVDVEITDFPNEAELLSYLYCVHRIASYYEHYRHDVDQSYKLLLSIKKLAENSVKKISSIEVDFDILEPEEIYTELSAIKHLPQIYARIIYSLGRVYIHKDDRSAAIKHFNLAKHLSEKHSLFEEFLSMRSGIGEVQYREIKDAVRKGECDLAKEKLFEGINLYKSLRADYKEYIIDYRPTNEEFNPMVPGADKYNRISCTKKIIKYYGGLISITADSNERSSYIKEIIKQLVGAGQSEGLIHDLAHESPSRELSSAYLILGEILLDLYKNKAEFKQLRDSISKSIEYTGENDDLAFIEAIYNKASQTSKQGEYTKADAYHGLLTVHQKQIDLGNLTNNQKEILSAKIEEYKFKRDNINKQLKRLVEYNVDANACAVK